MILGERCDFLNKQVKNGAHKKSGAVQGQTANQSTTERGQAYMARRKQLASKLMGLIETDGFEDVLR